MATFNHGQGSDLVLLHGRHAPDEKLDDWGFNGPILSGVAWVHWTYGHFNVAFCTKADRDAAKAATGWREVDDLVLGMPIHDDLVVITPPDQPNAYFGDFELQSTGFRLRTDDVRLTEARLRLGEASVAAHNGEPREAEPIKPAAIPKDRAAMFDLPGFAALGLSRDTDGNPCVWRNHYRCDDCDTEWTEEWSCQCDDECPNCGTAISPEDSDQILTGLSFALWNSLPERDNSKKEVL